MFREKRNKGFVSGLVLSLVFFIVAGVMGFMWYLHQHPMNSFGEDTRSGKEAKMTIYDMYPEVVGDVDGGSVIYLVQYSKEGDGQFAVVEAKEDDEAIKKIIDQAKAGTLEENPGTLIGTQLQPLGTNVNKSRNNRIVDLSAFIDSILDHNSTVYLNMNTSIYLSLTEHSRDGWYYIIGAAIFGGIGLVTLVSAFLLRKKSIAAFEELYQAYPELQGNVENLAGLAEFYDESLKVILYKNHLITYFKGTQAINLNNVQQLYLVSTTYQRNLIRNKIYQLCYIVKDSKKKHYLTIKTTKTVQEQLDELWDLIIEKFPDIHIGV
ncbi:hypothetical protein [Streptococcus infantis]|uniref:hypothetical protein n=1 Tax=Streptococcus infantis TaxID=68892 RepID=UPI0039C17F9E